MITGRRKTSLRKLLHLVFHVLGRRTRFRGNPLCFSSNAVYDAVILRSKLTEKNKETDQRAIRHLAQQDVRQQQMINKKVQRGIRGLFPRDISKQSKQFTNLTRDEPRV